MKRERTVMLAMTISVLLSVAAPAMAGCRAAGAAATQEERTTNQSSFAGPEVVTALMAWGNNSDGQLGDETNGNNRTMPVQVPGLRGAKGEAPPGGACHT